MAPLTLPCRLPPQPAVRKALQTQDVGVDPKTPLGKMASAGVGPDSADEDDDDDVGVGMVFQTLMVLQTLGHILITNRLAPFSSGSLRWMLSM